MTNKQTKFISEYLKHFNATKAAINAGYSEDTAASIGWENLRKPEIKDAIRAHIDETLEEDALTLKRRVADELIKIGFNEEENITARLKAIELLGKYQTMFTDKQEIEHSGQIVYLPEQVKEDGI